MRGLLARFQADHYPPTIHFGPRTGGGQESFRFDQDAEPLAPTQALDLPRALRAACLDPALVAGQADVGRLLPGYVADLLVVPSMALEEPIDAGVLAATRPLTTLVDGRVAYRSDAFDP
jgi:predicted amidohydrolase YtcJ